MHKTSICIFYLVHVVFSQENAGTNVAFGLRECYNNTLLATRDNRFPSTMTVLIDIIRRIEDRTSNMDARELSVQILQRFRQDGIWKSGAEVSGDIGIPYSPKGIEASKNKVQLKKLTPPNVPPFNNNSLNALERCSLHSMISATVERRQREGGESECNRVGRYVSRIHKRQSELVPETYNGNTFIPSSCPIEGGVVYTPWGTVAAGLVLSGIAAGLQPQSIPTPSGSVDNRYASTIAGELSEVSLQSITNFEVGNGGSWNSTLAPKYFFLEKNQRENVILTDAEIRGGLDGLYLALNVQDWKSRASKLKISQLLDMYYSQRGVFNESMRACNRKFLSTSQTSTEKLITEATNFDSLLDEETTYSVTIDKNSFGTLAKKAVDSYNTKISSLNDPQCSTDDSVVERASTDILIFIDTAWDYRILYPLLSYVLENIDVNKYNSEYKILDGVNCLEIVNKTTSILDFHEQYNQTQHQTYSSGFDYNKVIQVSEAYFKQKLENETDLTGQSMIVLMIPHNTPTDSQKTFVKNRRTDVFKRFLPDLRIIVAGSGTQTSYNDLVYNPTTEVITIPDSTDESSIKPVAQTLITKIKQVPRSVVNPICQSTFTSSETTTYDSYNYVEPNGINYHKIAPNYFASGKTDVRNIKVKGQGYGSLSVCWSRTEIYSRGNSSTTNCQNILSDEVVIDVRNACSGSITSCNPVYISVEGKYASSASFRCNDAACRFPDNIKYAITLENTRCASSAQRIISSFALLTLISIFMRL